MGSFGGYYKGDKKKPKKPKEPKKPKKPLTPDKNKISKRKEENKSLKKANDIEEKPFIQHMKKYDII